MTSQAEQLRKALESPAVRSLQAEKRSKRRKTTEDSELTDGLEDSFPASDPVSSVSKVTAGKPNKRRPARRQ